MKILIVDDEYVSREKAVAILSQFGECSTATSGKDALLAFNLAHDEGLPFDLMTLDISMPDMDGLTVLHLIRRGEQARNISLGRGLKVIMLTASQDSKTIMTSFREGCEAYLVKPFNKDNILGALKELEVPIST